MKRIALSLVLAILTLPLMADTVSSQRARIVADAFLSADGTRAAGVTLSGSFDTRARLMEETRSSEAPALYVFNRAGGGFVIISGDDAFGPVLAYSYTGSFRTDTFIPDNVREWMEDMAFSIGDIRADHMTASREVAQCWSYYENPTRAGGIKKADPVKLHETANWNQSYPYNLYCPMIEGDTPGQAITGCVATSIGILMYYYKYPTRALKDFPAHSGTGFSIPARAADYDYQWDKMLLNYKSNAFTEEQAQACARLLADIGQVGKLTYGVNSTGGQTAKVLALMTEYFGYDKGLLTESRYYYTDEEWIAKLKAELDVRPMSYTGRSDTGGHAFVMAGYDTEDNFYMNWGWGGSRNGYYSINGFYKYVNSHTGTFGFRPEAGGSFPPLYALYGGNNNEYKGVELVDATSVTPGIAFNVRVVITNKAQASFPMEAGIFHCDAYGNRKYMVSNAIDLSSLNAGYFRVSSIPCTITQDIEPGDRLYVFYHTKGQDDWVRIKCPNNEDLVDYIDISAHLSVEATTSLIYEKTTGTVTITALRSGITMTITTEGGAPVSTGVTSGSDKLIVNVDQLPKGSYKITLTSSTSTDSKEIRIVK